MISSAKMSEAKCDARIQQIKSELSEREKAADEKEKRLDQIEADVEGEVDRRLKKVVSDKKDELNKEYSDMKENLSCTYKEMTVLYKTRYLISIFYGVTLTVLLAGYSETIRSEVVTFFKTFGDVISALFLGIWDLGGFIARIGNLIPQETVAVIVRWLLQFCITIVFLGGIAFGLYCVCICLKTIFDNTLSDELTALVALGDLAVIVTGADYIRSVLPVNLVLLFILILIVYMIIRSFYEWDVDQERKKNILIDLGVTILVAATFIWALRTISHDLMELMR